MIGDKMLRWRLVVKFDDLKIQSNRDPSWTYPNDDASRFLAKIRRAWSDDNASYLNDVSVSKNMTYVTVNTDTVDGLMDFIWWVPMHTIPKSMVLQRMETP
jgi:hypothetical protein